MVVRLHFSRESVNHTNETRKNKANEMEMEGQTQKKQQEIETHLSA